jgi:hypothetical protein
MSASRRSRLEGLIAELDALEHRASRIQRAPHPTAEEIRQVHRAYQRWFNNALPEVPDESKPRFRDMYEGGSFVKRARAFLTDPLAPSPLHDPAAGPPFDQPWQHPFATTFAENVAVQRDILEAALQVETAPSAVLDELAALFGRLGEFLSVLKTAESAAVPAPVLANEADLQVLVHALLRLHYDDVRPEDPVSKHAGGSSRVDFALPEAGVVVETKMTRAGLADRQVGEELLIDFGRYGQHPACRAVLAVVYDPDRRISNPAGLVHDLDRPDGTPATRVVVIR